LDDPIEFFLNNTKYKIISIDNYSSGFTKNHIKNSRVKYISGDTKNIEKLIKKPNFLMFSEKKLL